MRCRRCWCRSKSGEGALQGGLGTGQLRSAYRTLARTCKVPCREDERSLPPSRSLFPRTSPILRAALFQFLLSLEKHRTSRCTPSPARGESSTSKRDGRFFAKFRQHCRVLLKFRRFLGVLRKDEKSCATITRFKIIVRNFTNLTKRIDAHFAKPLLKNYLNIGLSLTILQM